MDWRDDLSEFQSLWTQICDAIMMKKQIYVVVFALAALALYHFDAYTNGCSYDPDIRVDGKVIIVTGANTGIGKETVKDLVKRGGKVYMACRTVSRGQEALADIRQETGVEDGHLQVLQLDLASLTSIRNFVTEYKKRESRLDILIDNAGIFGMPYSLTEDGFEMTFGTNHLGHFLLTTLLVDLLIQSAPSRVVVVSSGLQISLNFENLLPEKKDYSIITAYGQSKLANVIFAKELSKRLKDKGVTAYSLHPGSISTDIGRHLWFLNIPILQNIIALVGKPLTKTTWHGTRSIIYTAIEPGIEIHSGEYFSDCEVDEPELDAEDDEIGQRLWEISMEYVKLDPSEIHPALSR